MARQCKERRAQGRRRIDRDRHAEAILAQLRQTLQCRLVELDVAAELEHGTPGIQQRQRGVFAHRARGHVDESHLATQDLLGTDFVQQ